MAEEEKKIIREEDVSEEAKESKEVEVETKETKEAAETEDQETAEVGEDKEDKEEAEAEAGEAAEADAAETEEVAEGEEKKSWAERRAAKKAAKGDHEKDVLKEQIAGLEDRVKRQLAEFENFRSRTDREKSAMFDNGARSVLEKILPVIDNFERGLEAVPEDKKQDPFVDGMDKIYRQLMTELDKMGVKPIEAVGQPFDPNFHNAVMQEESEELESGTVAQELQKGYTYKDNVLRHSMVSVVS